MTMIGKRNRRFRIEKRSGAVDAANQQLDEWVLHKLGWFEVKGQTGMGAIRQHTSDGVGAPVTGYSLRGRFDRSINENMRAVDVDGNVYEIAQVRHDVAGRNWTDVVTKHGGSDG